MFYNLILLKFTRRNTNLRHRLGGERERESESESESERASDITGHQNHHRRRRLQCPVRGPF